MVISLEMLGNDIRVLKFIAGFLADAFKANGECLQSGLPGFGQQADNQGAVEPAGQEDADWHVGHQATFDGKAKPVGYALLPLTARQSSLVIAWTERQGPEAPLRARCRRPQSAATSLVAACERP